MLRQNRKLHVLLDEPVRLDPQRILRSSRGYQVSAHELLTPSNLHAFSRRAPIGCADVEGRPAPAQSYLLTEPLVIAYCSREESSPGFDLRAGPCECMLGHALSWCRFLLPRRVSAMDSPGGGGDGLAQENLPRFSFAR